MEGTIDRVALHRYVDRVLVLHTERKSLNADIGAVYEEAKSAGFVTSIIRQIVRERQMDAEERLDHYALLDSYRRALGMLADTPLGQAAMASGARMPAAAGLVEEEGFPGSLARPPFAEQPVGAGMRAPVHKPRGRPRKAARDDELDALEPAGAA